MDNLNLWISDYLDEYAAGDFSEDVLIRGFRMSSGTWDSSTPGKPYCVPPTIGCMKNIKKTTMHTRVTITKQMKTWSFLAIFFFSLFTGNVQYSRC